MLIQLTAEILDHFSNIGGAKAQRRNQQLWKHYSVEEKAIKLTAKDGGATYKKNYQHKVKRKPKYRTILYNSDKPNFASLQLCGKNYLLKSQYFMIIFKNPSISLSGTMLGPSLRALDGLGWVSIKKPSTPTDAAARVR